MASKKRQRDALGRAVYATRSAVSPDQRLKEMIGSLRDAARDTRRMFTELETTTSDPWRDLRQARSEGAKVRALVSLWQQIGYRTKRQVQEMLEVDRQWLSSAAFTRARRIWSKD